MADKEKVTQILKEVQDDDNFKVFYANYEALALEAQNLEKLEQIKAEGDFGNIEYK